MDEKQYNAMQYNAIMCGESKNAALDMKNEHIHPSSIHPSTNQPQTNHNDIHWPMPCFHRHHGSKTGQIRSDQIRSIHILSNGADETKRNETKRDVPVVKTRDGGIILDHTKLIQLLSGGDESFVCVAHDELRCRNIVVVVIVVVIVVIVQRRK